MNGFRVDIYTAFHKELRQALFEFSMALAQADFKEKVKLGDQLSTLIHELREHTRKENTYAHPVLAPKLPKEKAQLEAAHEEHEEDLVALERLWLTLCDEKLANDKAPTIGLEFYRAFNRFISAYLMHLDDEEYLMQNAWELCRPSELFAIMVAFKGMEEPEVLPQIMKLVDANLSQDEKTDMYETIKLSHGENVLNVVLSRN